MTSLLMLSSALVGAAHTTDEHFRKNHLPLAFERILGPLVMSKEMKEAIDAQGRII